MLDNKDTALVSYRQVHAFTKPTHHLFYVHLAKSTIRHKSNVLILRKVA